MKLAVLARTRDPMSLRICRERITEALQAAGVHILPAEEEGPFPAEADLLWDPGLGMRRVPPVVLDAPVPVVVTNHGMRGFTLAPSESAGSLRGRLGQWLLMRGLHRDWALLGERAAAVITVSAFARNELCNALPVAASRVHVIAHGVDHGTFHPRVQPMEHAPCLLHYSGYQPKKNVQRILAAHASLPTADRPPLVLIVPGYDGPAPKAGDVVVHRAPADAPSLARWCRCALALVFCSLHESFGLPILEAMACGCPVITSNVTACPEVAGDAALLVDPRNTDAIAQTMRRIAAEPDLRDDLRQRGLTRAAEFTWRRSAEAHLEVFRAVLGGRA